MSQSMTAQELCAALESLSLEIEGLRRELAIEKAMFKNMHEVASDEADRVAALEAENTAFRAVVEAAQVAIDGTLIDAHLTIDDLENPPIGKSVVHIRWDAVQKLADVLSALQPKEGR